MKFLAEILKPLFDFLKWCCVEKGWKPTMALFVTLFLLVGIAGGIIYINTLKYQSKSVPQYTKRVINKPESIIPNYIEYKNRTLSGNKAKEIK